MTTNTPTEDDDLSVFDCTFEDFQKNISLLTKEVQTKVQEGCSNKDLDLALANGIKALGLMAFRVKDVKSARPDFLLHLVETAILQCDRMIRGDLRPLLSPTNQPTTYQ